MSNHAKKPSFTVVVNNFNYAEFLEGALDSALSQLGDDDEVVIVDDGSTDESLNILARYAGHPQVNVIHQQNQGQLKAVRTGIRAAQRDIVLLLDSDDEYLPGYLERLREVYYQHPQVTCVMTAAEVRGTNTLAVERNRENLLRMAISPGVIGTTRWATQLSYEFVGVPTSGVSLTRELALAVCELPIALDSTTSIPPIIARLLRIPENEARKSGLTADGVIVRTTSLMGAVKYSDDRPGFVYRIHDNNKFATSTRLGQHYVRVKRRRNFLNAAIDHLQLNRVATANELKQEIEQRLWGVRKFRRLHVRAQYLRAIPHTRGSVAEKLATIKAALFSYRRQ